MVYRKIISLWFLETVYDSKVTDKHQIKLYNGVMHLVLAVSPVGPYVAGAHLILVHWFSQ